MSHASQNFIPLNMAVLTVSDTRNFTNDTSGDLLTESLTAAQHVLYDRALVKDSVYLIRAIVSQWIADDKVNAILVTGGTGFSGRDSTPEALLPLFDKTIEGYGELFRRISYDEIASSTVQSRAVAGLANNTVIFAMPGSTNACRTAWNSVIADQLDARHKPCNFVAQLQQKHPQGTIQYCGSRS
ncbi:MAG: molybdenum cofactor biosynthesis protein B [Ketobacteraceae bacterium]|nr:molybdenum cofactor biosynthesis protein B [Ketobacteraceae bacterium]